MHTDNATHAGLALYHSAISINKKIQISWQTTEQTQWVENKTWRDECKVSVDFTGGQDVFTQVRALLSLWCDAEVRRRLSID